MKKAFIISISISITLLTLPAQDWQNKVKAQENRVQHEMNTQQQRVDAEFARQMDRVWKDMELEAAPAPPTLTPLTPKTYTHTTQPAEDQHIIVIPEPDQAVAKTVAPRTVAPRTVPAAPDLSEPVEQSGRSITANFYGQSVGLWVDPAMKFRLERPINEHRIAESWQRLKRTNYQNLITQLNRYAARLQLNDWGYCQLVNKAAYQLYPSDKNARTIFSWFVLSHAGYVATVSYERDKVYLLMPSKQRLYGLTFLRGKEHKLYVLDLDGNEQAVRRAKVFPNKYPQATKVLDFEIHQEPQMHQKVGTRVVHFTYQKQRYHIPIQVNRGLAEFYKTYPFVDLYVYMRAPLSAPARTSLVDSLKRIAWRLKPTNGRTREEEMVNFLLRFVQHAFPYKSDHDQFGRERYLFADEMLYYPYSDCEDRSVLFSYLVREITGLKVVGLLYEGHAATAVRFKGKVEGDYVMYRGSRYTVCDPTYINATYGKTLPDVQGQMARVIDF